MKAIPLTISGLLLFTGCANVSPIDTRQLADAHLIQEVLHQDALLRQISRECARLYPETISLAYETQTQWWQSNNRWVLLADQALNKQVVQSVERNMSESDTTLGLAISLKTSLQAKAERIQKMTDEPGAEGCRNLLWSYQQGHKDLAQTGLELQRLEVLAEDYFPPRAQTEGDLLQSQDRSQFVAERLAQSSLCAQAQLSALVRQWPREVYNVDCGQQQQHLIRCLWSDCQVLP